MSLNTLTKQIYCIISGTSQKQKSRQVNYRGKEGEKSKAKGKTIQKTNARKKLCDSSISVLVFFLLASEGTHAVKGDYC